MAHRKPAGSRDGAWWANKSATTLGGQWEGAGRCAGGRPHFRHRILWAAAEGSLGMKPRRETTWRANGALASFEQIIAALPLWEPMDGCRRTRGVAGFVVCLPSACLPGRTVRNTIGCCGSCRPQWGLIVRSLIVRSLIVRSLSGKNRRGVPFWTKRHTRNSQIRSHTDTDAAAMNAGFGRGASWGVPSLLPCNIPLQCLSSHLPLLKPTTSL